MVSLWHLPNMEICKLDVCVYMRAHICNKTCFEWTAMLLLVWLDLSYQYMTILATRMGS